MEVIALLDLQSPDCHINDPELRLVRDREVQDDQKNDAPACVTENLDLLIYSTSEAHDRCTDNERQARFLAQESL